MIKTPNKKYWAAVYTPFWKKKVQTANTLHKVTDIPVKRIRTILGELVKHGYLKKIDKWSYTVTDKPLYRQYNRSRIQKIILKYIRDEPKTIPELASITGYSENYISKVLRDCMALDLAVVSGYRRNKHQKVRLFSEKSEFNPKNVPYEKKITYKNTNAPYANRRKWERQAGRIL